MTIFTFNTVNFPELVFVVAPIVPKIVVYYCRRLSYPTGNQIHIHSFSNDLSSSSDVMNEKADL